MADTKKFLDLTGLTYLVGKLQDKIDGKANATHKHAAGDINSGTLDSARLPTVPVTKGGTGATDAATARTNLGVTPANIGAAPSTHNHAASDINSGTLSSDRLPTVPVAKGGTGATDAANARTNLGITPANIGAAASSDLTSHTGNKSNPHGVTKAQVGLGNVPNVATNDQTPTYSAATTLATLTSGEKLSVSMGKIMKAITDLISHIGNKSNPHGVTAAQVGAAASSHNHAATEITSGTLSSDRLPTVPVAKGGTGATTAEAARTNLGITPANIGAAASDHDHDATELGFMRADNVYGAPVFGDNDLNNWTQPGVYNCPSGATNVPSGLTDNYGVVTVFNVHGLENNLVQIFSPWTSSTSKIYMRTKNRTVWNGWKEIATADIITAGTEDLTAGTSTLESGKFYAVY